VHVAVIGAGALGRLYGSALVFGGAEVSFVVRSARKTAFTLERRPSGVRRTLEHPKLVTELPPADVALLCVRAEQVDECLQRLLADGPALPLVTLTPLLPPAEARLGPHVRGELVPALPAAAAELGPDGILRYWTPPLARTLFDSDRSSASWLPRLVAALNAGGVPAALASGAAARNAATTIAFFPLSVALTLAGSAARLAADRSLLELGVLGSRECSTLGARVGRVEPAVALALRIVTPASFRLLLAAARFAAPELASFLEDHFAHKLERQHAVLGADILELGREHGVALPALVRLLDCLGKR
jgi:2-dehydropantoate 2-reductase